MEEQSWTLGILCYNEAGTIKTVVERARHMLQQMTSQYEVLVIDDGSSDGSMEIIKELGTLYADVKPIIFEKNKGIGAGLNAVYNQAKNENVLAMAGDGQFDTEELLPYRVVASNMFISFYRKENTVYSGYRNILSFVNKKLNEKLLGITVKDVNWAQVYKRDHLRMLDLQLTSSLVGSEICAKLLYLGVDKIEPESRYLPRTYGQSKGSSLKTVMKAFKDIFTLVSIMKGFKKKHKKSELTHS